MTPKVKKLIDQGRLLPIFAKSGEDFALIGYRRKPGSRKSHIRPYLLTQPIPIPSEWRADMALAEDNLIPTHWMPLPLPPGKEVA